MAIEAAIGIEVALLDVQFPTVYPCASDGTQSCTPLEPASASIVSRSMLFICVSTRAIHTIQPMSAKIPAVTYENICSSAHASYAAPPIHRTRPIQQHARGQPKRRRKKGGTAMSRSAPAVCNCNKGLGNNAAIWP